MRTSRPWFHAKRYGWGWGLPATWQGWLVMAIFFAVVIAAPALLPRRAGAIAVFLAGGVLVAIAWRTGEPPRWHWGDEPDVPRGPFVRGAGDDTPDLASMTERLEGWGERRRQRRDGRGR